MGIRQEAIAAKEVPPAPEAGQLLGGGDSDLSLWLSLV
jgi:hypothetical protein